MDRALYSIEETRARLGGISRNSLYAMLRAGELPSVVIGCRRFVSAEAIAAFINNSTTSVSPSQDAVRSRRPLADAGQVLPSAARVSSRSQKSDDE
jgi:Helix-turn-helix domain